MLSLNDYLRIIFFANLIIPLSFAYSDNSDIHSKQINKKNTTHLFLTLNQQNVKDITSNSKKYYSKAAEYFKERKRPLRHFLDMGGGLSPIKSIYPFQTGKYPLFIYLNYRREKWGTWRLPVIFSIQYEHSFFYDEGGQSHRLTPLIGLRYPPAKDLRTFYVDLLIGTSFLIPPPDSHNLWPLPLDTRLLFTHIIGAKHKSYRLYIQWGLRTRLETEFYFSPILQFGLDIHL